MDFTAAAAATRLWNGFSRFMAANGLTLFTTFALIISLCFFSAICYFLFRLLETVRWRESLAGINWRNWSLGSLFRSHEKDEGEEEEDDEEDDEDEEYESEYDEDEMNAFKADVEMICKMSDEELEKLALLIAEERKKKMMATATAATSTTTDSPPE